MALSNESVYEILVLITYGSDKCSYESVEQSVKIEPFLSSHTRTGRRWRLRLLF